MDPSGVGAGIGATGGIADVSRGGSRTKTSELLRLLRQIEGHSGVGAARRPALKPFRNGMRHLCIRMTGGVKGLVAGSTAV